MRTTPNRLAERLSTDERTIRRAISLGMLRVHRPGPRQLVVEDGEVEYLTEHWELLTRLRRALRTEPNVRLAVLFGSVARGEDHEGSDIDLLVTLKDDGWPRKMALTVRLQEALDRDVDVVVMSDRPSQRPLLVAAICDGRVIADRDREWPGLLRRLPRLRRQVREADAADEQRLSEQLEELLATA